MASPRFLVTTAAKADLRDIIDYIRQDHPEAARRVLEEFRGAMRRLAETPGMGHLREDLAAPPLRFWSVYSYLIVYRAESKALQILRILHGARDVQRILERGSGTPSSGLKGPSDTP